MALDYLWMSLYSKFETTITFWSMKETTYAMSCNVYIKISGKWSNNLKPKVIKSTVYSTVLLIHSGLFYQFLLEWLSGFFVI